MPTRPPIHRPAGSRRAEVQRRAAYNSSVARRERQSLYDWAWRRYSKQRLARFPFCVECAHLGKARRAVVTDHVRPHEDDPMLFKDPDNHQSLCKVHHDRKTAREDGGFGNARRQR